MARPFSDKITRTIIDNVITYRDSENKKTIFKGFGKVDSITEALLVLHDAGIDNVIVTDYEYTTVKYALSVDDFIKYAKPLETQPELEVDTESEAGVE